VNPIIGLSHPSAPAKRPVAIAIEQIHVTRLRVDPHLPMLRYREIRRRAQAVSITVAIAHAARAPQVKVGRYHIFE
jgi:hypothetical protein